MGVLYDSDFYDAQSAKSLQSARATLPELFRHIQPRNVLDVGCGVGTWLRAAGELGVTQRLGVDGDYVDRHALMMPEELFLPLNLAQRGLFEAVTERGTDRFDLVMCLEVAEHLPFERAASLVEELCGLGDLVLFSGAIPYQYGTGHINEQWPEFWAMHFRAHGYACFDLLRPRLWGRSDVEWWYAQNLLVFAKEGSEAYAKLPAEAAAGGRTLAMVHPEAWLSNILNLWFRYRAAARQEESEDLKTLMRAWSEGAKQPPVLHALERASTAPPGAADLFPFTRTEVDYPEPLLAEAEARLAEVRALNEATLAELNAREVELNAMEVELANMQSSISWRITAPLRAVARLFSSAVSKLASAGGRAPGDHA